MDTIKVYQDNGFAIDNGIVSSKSSGVIGIDDKCGVAVLLNALAIMKDRDGIPEGVRFIFTTCEEHGFLGARYIDPEYFLEALNFVLDSGGLPIGRIVSQGASQYDFEVSVIGKMTHTGNPGGSHALLSAAELMCQLKTGRLSENTYVNVSDIHCEGNDNTIPGCVAFRGQILSFDDSEAQALLGEMDNATQKFLSENRLTGGMQYAWTCKGFCSESDIIEYAKQATEAASLKFEQGRTGAGSDAHIFIERGAKAVKISCGMMNVHTDDEYVDIEDLQKSTLFVLELAVS